MIICEVNKLCNKNKIILISLKVETVHFSKQIMLGNLQTVVRNLQTELQHNLQSGNIVTNHATSVAMMHCAIHKLCRH